MDQRVVDMPDISMYGDLGPMNNPKRSEHPIYRRHVAVCFLFSEDQSVLCREFNGYAR
jgi:hypothetical protein